MTPSVTAPVPSRLMPGIPNGTATHGGLSTRGEQQGGLDDPETADMPTLPDGMGGSQDNDPSTPGENPSGGMWSMPEEIRRTGNNDGAIQALKNALRPALNDKNATKVDVHRAGYDDPHAVWQITEYRHIYKINVAFVESVDENTPSGTFATVSLYVDVWNRTHGKLEEHKFLANFAMKVDDNGMASESVLASARYLIELFKANPPEQHLGVIHVIEGMTKLEIRQEFKRVTGMTAIEDIFIELPQAKERQEIKDAIDEYLDSLHLLRVKEGQIDFTWFYALSGMKKTYEKILVILSDRKLSFLKSNMITDFYDAAGVYFPGMNKIVYDNNCDAVTFMHELWHAYNDIHYGNNLSERDNEGVAYSFALYSNVASKIFSTINGIQSAIEDGDAERVERYVSEWNDRFIKYGHQNNFGGQDYTDLPNEAYLINLFTWTKIYLRNGSDHDFTHDDFSNIKQFLGLDFSRSFILQVIDIMNIHFSDWEEIQFYPPAKMSY